MSAAEQLRDQVLAVCAATRGLDDVEIEWALTDALTAIIIRNAVNADDATMRINDAARTMHAEAGRYKGSRWMVPSFKPRAT